MKHNTLKTILSLFLVICMMAFFAGCTPGEEDPTEPGSIETTQPTEKTTAPTEITAPTDRTEPAAAPSEETQAPTTPVEAETEPATEPPQTDPTFATERPTESQAVTFTDVDETVYAISSVNIRFGPSTDYEKVGSLSYGQSIRRTGIGSNGWSRVEYNGEEAYVYASYLSTTNPAQDTSGYPKIYSDATCDITISKEWYEDAWCYIAHLQFTDYTRFGTSCANGSYGGGYETTSHAASRLDAIFAVNGCYSAPYLNYTVVRSGELCNGSGKNLWCPAVYSNQNGLLQSAWESGGTAGIAGVNVDSLVENGLVTDTFCFGPPILAGGSVTTGSDTSRAQRTFIGTNGNPGDIWIIVSEGRYADGESAGLTYSQCARLLAEKGCIFGVPLDGGGSSTMVFRGKVLNSAKAGQRAVVDFVYPTMTARKSGNCMTGPESALREPQGYPISPSGTKRDANIRNC